MILIRKETKVNISNPFLLLPALLLAAHAIILLAILSFGTRANGYPMHPVALGIYAAFLTLMVIFWLLVAFWPQKVRWPQQSADKLLLVIMTPAFASLMLLASVWMLDGRFAPYDPGDSDLVWFFMLLMLGLICLTGVIYGSRSLVLIGLIFQLCIYILTHSLLNWIRYPSGDFLSGILGVRESTFFWIVGGYTGAFVALHWRQQRIALPPHWQFAVIVTNLVAGWMMTITLRQWPQNGDVLGWRSANTVVPIDGWNWLLPLAQGVIISAMILPLVISIFTMWKRRSLHYD